MSDPYWIPLCIDAARKSGETQWAENADIELKAITTAFDQECNDANDILQMLGLPFDQYRTEAGWLNIPKIGAAIRQFRESLPGANAARAADNAGEKP